MEPCRIQTAVQSSLQYIQMNQGPEAIPRLEESLTRARSENIHKSSGLPLEMCTEIENISAMQSSSSRYIMMMETHHEQKIDDTCHQKEQELHDRIIKHIELSVQAISAEITRVTKSSDEAERKID